MRTAMQRTNSCSCSALQHRQALKHVSALPSLSSRGRRAVVVRAAPADVDDEELERRLAKLKQAKGETPYGQSSKAPPKPVEEAPKKKKKEKVVYDFSDEVLHYEGPPHRGDLAINLALGTTLFWLPLTIAALSRGLFVNYKFTNKRISVSTNAPWKTEQLDAAYQEVKEVRSIPRGIGAWGDMVVVLKDGSKIEMRALDRFRELQEYILKRRDELVPRSANELTQEELMGEAAAPAKKGGKGFA
ncbi:hypothetical protein PLESTB_001622300 [Pleodorina starrii]|uniref:YdbS-like PH domain-containing protein n=1 Tax=Pleodorina starrii TaxID=330485 RepID=A0A9W6BZS2_9CHLO|nr:hypothetical protein PLESTM_002041400 [Pleodorina starrii]GLC60516.1 hypothetical protein PLESTB_001622300 [Pleodorina starrii]GLC76622.1 hypothetical protein PLESTF_001806800 [Pleodorina starrii]